MCSLDHLGLDPSEFVPSKAVVSERRRRVLLEERCRLLLRLLLEQVEAPSELGRAEDARDGGAVVHVLVVRGETDQVKLLASGSFSLNTIVRNWQKAHVTYAGNYAGDCRHC